MVPLIDKRQVTIIMQYMKPATHGNPYPQSLRVGQTILWDQSHLFWLISILITEAIKGTPVEKVLRTLYVELHMQT